LLICFTIFVHSNFDAFAETAGAALVAVGLINQTGALTLGLANVLAIPANGALNTQEENSQQSGPKTSPSKKQNKTRSSFSAEK